MARVELQNITKSFRGVNGQTVCAVNRVSFAVEDREFLALVGPSASGKTTTLRLIAGLVEADEGIVSLGDKNVNGIPPQARDIAMVFQSHALFPHLTAFENIALGLKLRGASRNEITARVRETTELLGLTDCLARKPAELSGGQRQRVALGRALVRRPQALLLDEPFANLDAPLRRELRRELLRLHRDLGLTIILVTHDQAEALACGQRVAVMKGGSLEQIGTPGQIRAAPATPFVAAFLDPSPL